MKKQDYYDVWNRAKEDLISKYLSENDETKKSCLKETILGLEKYDNSHYFQNLLEDVDMFSKS